MAKCPQCSKNWRWDWCQDVYVDAEYKAIAIQEQQIHPKVKLTMFKCDCGFIPSMGIDDKDGFNVHNCKEWQDIVWADMDLEHNTGVAKQCQPQ